MKYFYPFKVVNIAASLKSNVVFPQDSKFMSIKIRYFSIAVPRKCVYAHLRIQHLATVSTIQLKRRHKLTI